jgi:CRISPR-associated protein Cmr2
MKKYYALTIGPIYDTINQVKRTRSVWGASYLYSWLMKQILTEVSEKKEIEIVLPYFDTDIKSENGAGLFNDRAFFKGNGGSKPKIEEAISKVLDDLAKDISPIEEDQIGVKTFLIQYFNFHIVEIDFQEPIPLATLNKLLDKEELFKNSPLDITDNYVLRYLSNIANNQLLHKDAFGNDTERNFLSLSEIATTSLARLKANEYKKVFLQNLVENRKRIKKGIEEQEFMDVLENDEVLKKYLKPFNKYIGILYADGDGIGDLIAKCSTNEQLRAFSKSLFDFCKKAEIIIDNYGGKGIYLGGEDILAFIPLVCYSEDTHSRMTFFELIMQIDEAFKETVQAFAFKIELEKLPTLSFGLMLSYNKYPLKEAMESAHELLMEAKSKNVGKNAINILFQKHSGQKNACIIKKEKITSFQQISSFINIEANKDEFLSGVMHRLNEAYMYELFAKSLEPTFSLKAFVKNFMDIPEVKPNTFEEQFINLATVIHEDYTGQDFKDKSHPKNILYTILRINQFLNSKYDA